MRSFGNDAFSDGIVEVPDIKVCGREWRTRLVRFWVKMNHPNQTRVSRLWQTAAYLSYGNKESLQFMNDSKRFPSKTHHKLELLDRCVVLHIVIRFSTHE